MLRENDVSTGEVVSAVYVPTGSAALFNIATTELPAISVNPALDRMSHVLAKDLAKTLNALMEFRSDVEMDKTKV